MYTDTLKIKENTFPVVIDRAAPDFNIWSHSFRKEFTSCEWTEAFPPWQE